MAWTDRYIQGSFRGIPFFLEEHEKTGGRNAVSHEIPDRNTSPSEDIGKKSDGFKLEAYVLGDQYYLLRDALIIALESPDPGLLVHPYLGALEVQPAGFVLKEVRSEGRMARFQMNFIEAAKPSFPVGILNEINDFVVKAASYISIVQTAFTTIVSFSNLPAFALESSRNIVLGFATAIRDGIDTVNTNADRTAALLDKISNLETDVDELFQDPEALSASIVDLLNSLKDVSDVPENPVFGKDDRLTVFDGISTYGNDQTEDNSTPTKATESANNLAIINLIQETSIANLAENSALKEYTSSDEALGQRDHLIELVDNRLTRSITDETFSALRDLKSSIVNVVPNPSQQLGTLKDFELLDSMPSLVVTYDLYESLDQESQFLNINDVANPVFVSGKLRAVVNG